MGLDIVIMKLSVSSASAGFQVSFIVRCPSLAHEFWRWMFVLTHNSTNLLLLLLATFVAGVVAVGERVAEVGELAMSHPNR